MRIKHSLIIGTFLLFVTSIVGAVTYGPTRAAGGIQTRPSSSWGGSDGSSGIYERGDAGMTYHPSTGAEVVLSSSGGGGGSGTVTSVATDSTLTGGPITSTGTLGINLGNANTWTASQNVASVALTDGSSIATNAALGNTFTVTLGGNRTLANPSNLVAGGTYQWIVTQDSTGGRTLSFGSDFTWPGSTAPALSTTPSASDLISCVASSTSNLLCAFAGGDGSGGGGGSSTLSASYNTGASASDQTMLVQSAKGGPVIVKANGSGTGALLKVEDSSGNALASFSDNATQTIASNVASSGSAVNLKVNAPSGYTSGDAIECWAVNGTCIASMQYDSGSYPAIIANGAVIGLMNNNGSPDGVVVGNTTVGFYASGGQRAYVTSTGIVMLVGLLPSDLSVASGGPSNRWSADWSQVFGTVVGSPLSSTGSNVTIAPTSGIHHVTGTGSVKTISLPVTGFVGCIDLIPDGAFTTVTGGNVALPSTAVVDRTLRECFDGTSWYPSY